MSCLLTPLPPFRANKQEKVEIRMKEIIPCSLKPGKPAEGGPESAGSCIYLSPTGTLLVQPNLPQLGNKHREGAS